MPSNFFTKFLLKARKTCVPKSKKKVFCLVDDLHSLSPVLGGLTSV